MAEEAALLRDRREGGGDAGLVGSSLPGAVIASGGSGIEVSQSLLVADENDETQDSCEKSATLHGSPRRGRDGIHTRRRPWMATQQAAARE